MGGAGVQNHVLKEDHHSYTNGETLEVSVCHWAEICISVCLHFLGTYVKQEVSKFVLIVFSNAAKPCDRCTVLFRNLGCCRSISSCCCGLLHLLIFCSCNCHTSGVILEMPKITLSNFTSRQTVAFKERNLFKDLLRLYNLHSSVWMH